ncbi:MAG: multicopper oxidase family protein [Acidobacteria bacterium]|nr:multicopper oxidase family protein [Acidobacteriota bacterium]
MTRRRFFGLCSAAVGCARAEGLLEASLEARPEWMDLDGRAGWRYAYNGRLPGPVLEARPGDTVRVALTNRLAEATNLHFHGLHIPPTGSGDNPFLHIPPGESFTYEFTIPEQHPSGTFWYHPHVHGSAARQVSLGLAGLFVVRGEMDEIPEIAAASERFLVLQDWPEEPSPMERIRGREGALVTASGLRDPILPAAQGGLMRLRILNASSSRFYRLRMEDHPWYVIATDGGPIPEPAGYDELLVTPGQRVEVLVKGDRAEGRYRLLNLPYDRGGPLFRGLAGETLATLEYQGRAETTVGLPTRLPEATPLPKSDLPRRTLVMSEGMMGMSFTINGRTFDDRRVDTRVRLGSVEEWEIVNRGGMDHPFHLHTNSFQVVGADGVAERARRDVVLVPRGERRVIRAGFFDYPGKTVYHCHILDHEDLGMMGTLEVAA